jgi:hypothetical protein
MEEAQENATKEKERKEAEWINTSTNCTTDIVLILMMQFTLVIFLLCYIKAQAKNQASNETNLPENDANLVICRIICTVFLHISLSGEL